MKYRTPETYHNETTIQSVVIFGNQESEYVTDEGVEIFGYVDEDEQRPYTTVFVDGAREAGVPISPKYWGSEPTEHSLVRKIFCQEGEFSTPYYKVVDRDNLVLCKFVWDDGCWRTSDWNDNWQFGPEYLQAVAKLLDEIDIPADSWSWVYEVVLCPTR